MNDSIRKYCLQQEEEKPPENINDIKYANKKKIILKNSNEIIEA